MWELDYKGSWAPKSWCFWTVILEKTFGLQDPTSPSNQSWIFIGRTDAKAPIPWLPDAKSWLIWKDPHAGKDREQEEKEMTEDEMVGWHQQLDRHDFEQIPGVGDGKGSLVCCCPWGHKESDLRYFWTELRYFSVLFLHKSTYWLTCWYFMWHTYIEDWSSRKITNVIRLFSSC